MKVSNFTPDNGGFSRLRVISFWSLLAFGRSLLDNSVVSRSFDIVIVGWKVGALAPRDVTFVHWKQYLFSHRCVQRYAPTPAPWIPQAMADGPPACIPCLRLPFPLRYSPPKTPTPPPPAPHQTTIPTAERVSTPSSSCRHDGHIPSITLPNPAHSTQFQLTQTTRDPTALLLTA